MIQEFCKFREVFACICKELDIFSDQFVREITDMLCQALDTKIAIEEEICVPTNDLDR